MSYFRRLMKTTQRTIGSALLALLLLGTGESVLAYDASLPYQNYPSFECLRRNALRECVDFTYDPNDRSSSSSSSRRTSTTSGNGDIEISMNKDGDGVRPGEFLRFIIRLENTRRSRVTTDVRVEFASDLDYQSSSDDGEEISSDEVEWQDVRIDARDEEELELRMRVRSGARTGRSLRLRVYADGNTEDFSVVTSSRSRSNDDDCDEDDDDDCEDLDRSGDVRVRITSSPDPFEPGEQVHYAIRIDNEENFDRRIDVRATIDPDTTYVSASHSAERSGRVIRWDDLRIDEDETISLLLNVYTDRDIRDGDEIHLEVEVDGNTEDEEDTEAQF